MEAKIAQIFALVPIIAVMFTFSFGSAMAATNYTADQVASELTRVINEEQLTYVNAAKVKALASITYNDEGFTTEGYQKATIEAVADKVVADVKKDMEAEARKQINLVTSDGLTKADLDTAVAAVAAKNTVATDTDFLAAMDALADYANEVQAPATKAYYEGLIAKNYDASKYPATGAYTASGVDSALTAQGVIEYVISAAKAEIVENSTDNSLTDAQKIAAYKKAYTDIPGEIAAFKDSKGNTVATIEQGEIDDANNAVAVDKAMAAFKEKLVAFYEANAIAVTTSSDEYDLTALATLFTDADETFYTEKTVSKNATLFGVEIKNIAKATRAEATAVNKAFYAAVGKTLEVVEVYADGDATKIDALAADEDTMIKAAKVAGVYEDVVDLGEALKKAKSLGKKLYDDAKVEKVVEAAKAIVYGDLGVADDAEEYIRLAVNEVYLKSYTSYYDALGELRLESSYEYLKLLEAIDDAGEKFQDTIIKYGDKATAESDKKYCKNYYAAEAASDYEDIKADAFEALVAAQSYEDIDAALEVAAAELSKLLLAENESAVTKERAKYVDALYEYADEVYELKGDKDYTDTSADWWDKGQQYRDTYEAGAKLINEAITVEGVKAAYSEAKALFDKMKTNKELEAELDAVEKLINALPYKANITVADKAQIVAAVEAYGAYLENAGAETSLAEAELFAAMEKIYALEKEALDKKVTEAEKALDAADKAIGDAEYEQLVALKDSLTELKAEVDAYNEEVEAYNEEFARAVPTIENADVEAALTLAEGDVWDAETELAYNAVIIAMQDDADTAAINAAIDAYNKLTDRQQYLVDYWAEHGIDAVISKAIAMVESLKLKASSKATKGAITVTWKVTGDAEAADGYQIWKSTKKNSGFKKAFTTTKTSYKNTKGLKKGTRYYYKVRAYVVVGGETYYSDWSNKAYRVAK